MFLAGIQKLSLLDYPGVVACTVFTAGCNLRCPFCHNAGLVVPEQLPAEAEKAVRKLSHELASIPIMVVP